MTFSPRTETYVNVSSLTTPFNITVTKPTGTVNGDILFCHIAWYAATTIDSVPSGWQLLGEYLANTDRYALYYKIASGEGASWVWSFAATAKVRAVCSCYTSGDFNGSSPINVVSNTAYRTNNNQCIAASMDVSSANSPMVFWGCAYSTASKTFTKPSVPTTDWVEDDDAGNTTPDFWTEVCSMIWASSDATGDMAATISASLATKHAFAVALTPGAQALSQTVSDITGLLDSAATQQVGHQTVADLLGLLDTTLAKLSTIQTVADITGLLDSIVAAQGQSAAASDIAGLLESLTLKYDGKLTPTDIAGLVETVSLLRQSRISTAELAELLDTIATKQDSKQVALDLAGLLDSAVLLYAGKHQPLDSAGLYDSVDIVHIPVGGAEQCETIVDLLGLLDSVTLNHAPKNPLRGNPPAADLLSIGIFRKKKKEDESWLDPLNLYLTYKNRVNAEKIEENNAN